MSLGKYLAKKQAILKERNLEKMLVTFQTEGQIVESVKCSEPSLSDLLKEPVFALGIK